MSNLLYIGYQVNLDLHRSVARVVLSLFDSVNGSILYHIHKVYRRIVLRVFFTELQSNLK